MSEENYNKFANIILDMIDLNLENQINLDPHILASMSKEQYAEQFATIRFDLGRRTGKTRFIQEYLKNSDGGAMALVHNNEMRKRYEDSTHVFAVNYSYWSSENYRFIFVDEPKLVMNNISQYEIYNTLASNELQCFIFIGN